MPLSVRLALGRRPLIALLSLAVAGCASDPLVDDYRESWAVIRGRVVDDAGVGVAGATVTLVPVMPAYARGETVTSAADGSYLGQISAFGVPSFRASVRLQAASGAQASGDTLVTKVWVAERDRGERPDTLDVLLRLRLRP